MLMSYARFGYDDSDVYVFLSSEGYLECCGCSLNEQWYYETTDEMLAHLEEHRAQGHNVPQDCIDELLADKEENDQWIATYDPIEEERERREANQRIEDIWQIAKDELGYTHPGPKKFDLEAYIDAWQKAQAIYEQRRNMQARPVLPTLQVKSVPPVARTGSKRVKL